MIFITTWILLFISDALVNATSTTSRQWRCVCVLSQHANFVCACDLCNKFVSYLHRWDYDRLPVGITLSALYNKKDFFMWIKGGIDSLYYYYKCRELERWYEIAPWMVHSHCIICVHSCRLSALNDRPKRSEKVVNTAASFRLTLSFTFTSFPLLRYLLHLHFLSSHREAFNLFSLRESEIIFFEVERGVITR